MDDDEEEEEDNGDYEDDGNEVEDHRVEWSGNNVAFTLAEGE